jgi:two-component system response regulator DctR
MSLVVAGQSSEEIARTLAISHRTVELHRSHVFEKLGVRSAVELVRFAVDAGLR